MGGNIAKSVSTYLLCECCRNHIDVCRCFARCRYQRRYEREEGKRHLGAWVTIYRPEMHDSTFSTGSLRGGAAPSWFFFAEVRGGRREMWRSVTFRLGSVLYGGRSYTEQDKLPRWRQHGEEKRIWGFTSWNESVASGNEDSWPR